MRCQNGHRMRVVKSVTDNQTSARCYKCPDCGEVLYTGETVTEKRIFAKIRKKQRLILKNRENNI